MMERAMSVFLDFWIDESVLFELCYKYMDIIVMITLIWKLDDCAAVVSVGASEVEG